jgi:hypothetical protein
LLCRNTMALNETLAFKTPVVYISLLVVCLKKCSCCTNGLQYYMANCLFTVKFSGLFSHGGFCFTFQFLSTPVVFVGRFCPVNGSCRRICVYTQGNARGNVTVVENRLHRRETLIVISVWFETSISKKKLHIDLRV